MTKTSGAARKKSAPQPESKASVVAESSDRVAQLEAELERARQEMRAFSYSVSHDLRAPLRAVEGFTRILLEDYAQKLDEDGQKFLENVIQNAQIMGALIEGLLSYHRLNEKPVQRSALNMAQLTRDVVDALPKPSQAVEIRIDGVPNMIGDPALMRTAVEHLITNALKFSKRRDKPVIEIGGCEQDGEAVLCVKDNGVGFDMQYANKLFQVFQKLQKEPDFDGFGVGLALVRRIAEKHGGRVWAEAKPDDGAKFCLAVPK